MMRKLAALILAALAASALASGEVGDPILEGVVRVGGSQTFLCQDPTSTLCVVKAGASQSGAIFEVRDASDVVLFRVNADGTVSTGGSGNTLTGPAGGMIVQGGPNAGDDLTLRTNATATAGDILFGESKYADCDLKSVGGVLTCGADATGGGGPEGVRVTFTAQTSVTITHNFGTLAYSVQCFDTSNNPLHFDALSTRTTTTAVPDFNGVSVSGDCVAIPGGRGAPYVDTFSAQTSLAITGSTHGKGCDVAVFVYSADDPRDRLYAGYTVDDGTCDVAVDLGSVAQSGKVVIL